MIEAKKISFFKNEKIESITYNEFIGDSILSRTYRRWGNKIFEHYMDMPLAREFDGEEVNYESLPEEIKTIFEAKDKKGIEGLIAEGKLSGFSNFKIKKMRPQYRTIQFAENPIEPKDYGRVTKPTPVTDFKESVKRYKKGERYFSANPVESSDYGRVTKPTPVTNLEENIKIYSKQNLFP